VKLVWFGRRDVAIRVMLRVDPACESELGEEVAVPLGQHCQACTLSFGGRDSGFMIGNSSGAVHAECVDDELMAVIAEVPQDPGAQLVRAGRLVSLALASRNRERKVFAVASELRQRAIDLGREVGPYLKLVKGEVDSDAGMEAAAQKLWGLVDARKHFSELAVASNGEVFGKPANAGGS
jgi:hypothetical protein